MRPFKFVNGDGHALVGRLDMPTDPPLATALFAHCFTCTKDIAAARRIAQRLTAMGLAVLRFDFTGLGHSSGEFENSSFSGNVDDLISAARALTDANMAPSLLIGHSLGGAAAIAAAPQIPSVKAIVTLGAPFEPGHVVHNFGAALDEIERKGKAQVMLAGRPFTISHRFVQDVAQARLEKALAGLKRALLVMHAPQDMTVGIENASAIFAAAKHPKSFITLDSADHLISSAEDAEYAADVIAAWSARYLDLTAPPAPQNAPEGVIRVREVHPEGLVQDITYGPDHHLIADEPKKFGGTNRGLTPYGLVCAGLGACTSMTIRMYARRKSWPLTGIEVDVTHDKIHAEAAQNEGAGKIDQFTRIIRLKGELTPQQHAKLLEIADKCPVHRTLERQNNVTTRLE